MQLLSEKNFNRKIDNKRVGLYTLRNNNGCVAQFTNYGARWLSMWVRDKNGKWDDVVLGFGNLDDYLNAEEKYYGAIVGRVAGRISNGSFSLQGATFKLSNNDLFGKPLKNHLHGGQKGFSFQVWDAAQGVNETGDEYLDLVYFSEEGEEGYPGNLKVNVRYILNQDNAMVIVYTATTDQPTLVNLTNHAYFNLKGEGNGGVSDHKIYINADRFAETNEELIPTGRLVEVKNTPLDFMVPQTIESRWEHSYPGHVFAGKGYVVAYILNKEKERLTQAACITDEKSGRRLDLYTDQPSLQCYNAFLLTGKDKGKSGLPYRSGAGLALEAQAYPDAINHEHFPGIVLNKGEVYRQQTVYHFH